MADLIACPHGITLPYSSIFNLSLRHQSKRPVQARPSSYFWDQATQAPGDDPRTPGAAPDQSSIAGSIHILSDTEDEPNPKQTRPAKTYRKHLRLKLRKIAFKAFTPKADGTGQKNNVVSTTEIVTRQEKVKVLQCNGLIDSRENERFSVFKSWKLKSKAGGVQLQKMVAMVKHRVSAASPAEEKPKTWEEYHYLYANEQIDVHNPPLPPMDQAADADTPTAFHARFFPAPKPSNQQVRQLVLNRLRIFGKKGFDSSEEGIAKSQIQIQLGDQLMEQGKAPSSLDMPWECRSSIASDRSDMETTENRVVQNPTLPPDTLEQHPVFRRIVQRCRELFQVSVGILSVSRSYIPCHYVMAKGRHLDFTPLDDIRCNVQILDDDRQIFLAESGLDAMPVLKGLREVTRDITFCAHTVLSGRKGFTVLDTHKDWRFQNGPLVQNFGLRFYAGVPLMAPNLDGSIESEQNSCPIGTLCLVDWEPREAFTIEDRKKLVYLSEYARREIEKWFAKKMDHKIDTLEASKDTWKQQVSQIDSSDAASIVGPEVLADAPQHDGFAKSVRGASGTLRSVRSNSNEKTSQSSHTDHSVRSTKKSAPGLFEDINLALKPNMRRVFDLATKLVSETLDLSLVYLAASVPYDESNQLGRTIIVSGHNIPMPVPVFDTALHLKALRTPEGGLLYQNPSIEEAEKDGLQPLSSTPGDIKANSNSYASAMLLAVSSESQPNGGGFILAGYTDDAKRVFGAEDVSYMKQFARELSRYTAKLRL